LAGAQFPYVVAVFKRQKRQIPRNFKEKNATKNRLVKVQTYSSVGGEGREMHKENQPLQDTHHQRAADQVFDRALPLRGVKNPTKQSESRKNHNRDHGGVMFHPARTPKKKRIRHRPNTLSNTRGIVVGLIGVRGKIEKRQCGFRTNQSTQSRGDITDVEEWQREKNDKTQRTPHR